MEPKLINWNLNFTLDLAAALQSNTSDVITATPRPLRGLRGTRGPVVGIKVCRLGWRLICSPPLNPWKTTKKSINRLVWRLWCDYSVTMRSLTPTRPFYNAYECSRGHNRGPCRFVALLRCSVRWGFHDSSQNQCFLFGWYLWVFLIEKMRK